MVGRCATAREYYGLERGDWHREHDRYVAHRLCARACYDRLGQSIMCVDIRNCI